MIVFKMSDYKKNILSGLLFCFCALSFAQVKHTVEKGETYYSISKKYGITVDKLCEENSLTKETTLKLGQVLIIPSSQSKNKEESKSVFQESKNNDSLQYGEYIVQQGDTLAKIAREYGKTIGELKALNGFGDDKILKIGEKVKVPGTVKKTGQNSSVKPAAAENVQRKFDTYTVQKGDTFYRIAKINGISVDELKSLNGFDDSSVLRLGDKLKIPVTIVNTENAKLPDLSESDPRNYSAKKGDSTLTWPVKNPEVTYLKGKVSGVQLSAATNETVKAIRAGTVMYVGNYRGYGQVVFVQSKTGHIYAYCGLGAIKVHKGDYLVFGDVIGTAGTDSIKGKSQISLMVFQKGQPVDPAKAPRG